MSLFFLIYENVKLLIKIYLKPETNEVTTAGTVSLVSPHPVTQTHRNNLHHVHVGRWSFSKWLPPCCRHCLLQTLLHYQNKT